MLKILILISISIFSYSESTQKPTGFTKVNSDKTTNKKSYYVNDRHRGRDRGSDTIYLPDGDVINIEYGDMKREYYKKLKRAKSRYNREVRQIEEDYSRYKKHRRAKRYRHRDENVEIYYSEPDRNRVIYNRFN